MAKKANALKLSQTSRGQAEVTNHQPATEIAALSMMQMPLPRAKISPLRRKLPVFIDAETRAQIEHPVKIFHAV
jgi:hypothetical protein